MGDADKGGVSLFRKEIPLPCTLPEKIHIAGEQLEELQCLPTALPIARRCRVAVAIRFASAPIIRCCAAVGGSAALRMRHTPCGCRSADLVEVHSNSRLPRHYSMRRAPAMPLFRTQSAAEVTSLAPHDSKARLRLVTTRRRFMAKPCTPHLHCAARAALQDRDCQCAGSRGKAPRPFLLGGIRGAILFPRKENSPPLPFPCAAQGNHCTLTQ